MPKRRNAVTLAAVVWFSAAQAKAEPLPLWEAGAGAAILNLTDYRGSNERKTYVLPVPYLVYRGEVLQVDRQKVRGLLYSSEIAEFDFSVGGSVPVDSEDNQARRGMPDLDPTLELGPSLNFFLYRSPTRQFNLDLRLPFRAVEATDFSGIHHQGWLFHPHLNIDLKGIVPGPGWNLGLLAGPLFGSRRYHEYFYGVAPQFATAERAPFAANGGYAGAQFIAALSKRFDNYWFGAFVKADTLEGAAFEDSPLVRKKNFLTGGFAFAWVFAKSGKLVDAKE